jgi:NADPH:quinone reductase
VITGRRATVLRCRGLEGPLRAEDAEVVAATGQSLVEMRAASVTHLDRLVLAGRLAHQMQPPFVPGSEGSGIVITSDVHPAGARVVVRGHGVGVVRPGTWGTVAAVPDGAVHPCPESLDLTASAGALAPALTAYTAVRSVGAIRPGETVAVTGASGVVGQMCAAMIRAAGATAVGVVRSRAAAEALAGSVDRVVIQPGTALPGCDALIDTVGGPVLGVLLEHVNPGGRVVLVGHTAGDTVAVSLDLLIGRGIRLLPVSMQRRAVDPAVVADVLEDVATGRLPYAVELVSGHTPQAALELLTRGSAGRRVLLNVSELSTTPVPVP